VTDLMRTYTCCCRFPFDVALTWAEVRLLINVTGSFSSACHFFGSRARASARFVRAPPPQDEPIDTEVDYVNA
jgi:hypothetical protein